MLQARRTGSSVRHRRPRVAPAARSRGPLLTVVCSGPHRRALAPVKVGLSLNTAVMPRAWCHGVACCTAVGADAGASRVCEPCVDRIGGCCAGRSHSRSDSLANLNDSDSEAESTEGRRTAAAASPPPIGTGVERAKVVHFQKHCGGRQPQVDEARSAVVGGQAAALSRPQSSPAGCSTGGQAGLCPSQLAASRAIARHQAELDAQNLQLSKKRPKDVVWQHLKRLPGDPKHFNMGTRLRVATLSRSLIPCTLPNAPADPGPRYRADRKGRR